MAIPDAAMAPARPVGLRVVDFFQGRRFSFVAPFVVVDMRDTASESRGGNNDALPLADSGAVSICCEGNAVLRAVGDSTMGVIVITLPFSPWPVSRVVSGVVAARVWLTLILSDLFEEERRTSCEEGSSVLGMVDDVFGPSCWLSVGGRGGGVLAGVAGCEREPLVEMFGDGGRGEGGAGAVGVGVGEKGSEDLEAVTGVVRSRPDNSPALIFTSLICRSEVSAKLLSEYDDKETCAE